jgi:hypothetical protein
MTSNENQFDFSEWEDNPDIQDQINEVEQPITLEPTPEPTVIEPTVTEPEVDLSDYSNWAKLALSYQQVDGKIPADVEIKKDMTADELKDLIYQTAAQQREEDLERHLKEKEEAERTRLAEKGLTDEYYAYLQQILAGGDPKVVTKVAQIRSYAEAEVETDEELEAVVKAGLIVRHGNSPETLEMIESHVKNTLTDTDKLKAAAKSQQEYLANVAQHLEEQDKQRVKALREEHEAKEAQFAKDVATQVKSGIYGLNLTKQEQQELIDYMTKKTETVDIQTPNGVKREKVTKEQADKMKHSSDIQRRVYEANARRVGYEKVVNKITDTVNKNDADKFLSTISMLEKQKTPVTSDEGVWEEI